MATTRQEPPWVDFWAEIIADTRAGYLDAVDFKARELVLTRLRTKMRKSDLWDDPSNPLPHSGVVDIIRDYWYPSLSADQQKAQDKALAKTKNHKERIAASSSKAPAKPPKKVKAFKPEAYARGLSKRDVAKKLFADELAEYMNDKGIKSTGSKFIGHYSRALKEWMENEMTEAQTAELDAAYTKWNEEGMPSEMQNKYRQDHLGSRTKDFLKDLQKLMGVHAIVIFTHEDAEDDEVTGGFLEAEPQNAVPFSQHNKKLVQEVVNKLMQWGPREFNPDSDVDATKESQTKWEIELDDQGVPILPKMPNELKLTRTVFRQYIQGFYRKITNNPKAVVPWREVNKDWESYVDTDSFPAGFLFEDPSRLVLDDFLSCWKHWSSIIEVGDELPVRWLKGRPQDYRQDIPGRARRTTDPKDINLNYASKDTRGKQKAEKRKKKASGSRRRRKETSESDEASFSEESSSEAPSKKSRRSRKSDPLSDGSFGGDDEDAEVSDEDPERSYGKMRRPVPQAQKGKGRNAGEQPGARGKRKAMDDDQNMSDVDADGEPEEEMEQDPVGGPTPIPAAGEGSEEDEHDELEDECEEGSPASYHKQDRFGHWVRGLSKMWGWEAMVAIVIDMTEPDPPVESQYTWPDWVTPEWPSAHPPSWMMNPTAIKEHAGWIENAVPTIPGDWFGILYIIGFLLKECWLVLEDEESEDGAGAVSMIEILWLEKQAKRLMILLGLPDEPPPPKQQSPRMEPATNPTVTQPPAKDSVAPVDPTNAGGPASAGPLLAETPVPSAVAQLPDSVVPATTPPPVAQPPTAPGSSEIAEMSVVVEDAPNDGGSSSTSTGIIVPPSPPPPPQTPPPASDDVSNNAAGGHGEKRKKVVPSDGSPDKEPKKRRGNEGPPRSKTGARGQSAAPEGSTNRRGRSAAAESKGSGRAQSAVPVMKTARGRIVIRTQKAQRLDEEKEA